MTALTDRIGDERAGIEAIGAYLDGLDGAARWREVAQLGRTQQRALYEKVAHAGRSTSSTSSERPGRARRSSTTASTRSRSQGRGSGSPPGVVGRRKILCDIGRELPPDRWLATWLVEP
jgi:hypothetical protein